MSTTKKASNRVGSGRLVRHQGRLVCRNWYRKYVLNEATTKRPYTPPVQIIAGLYLPAIHATRDPAETRLVDLNRRTDRAWVQVISDCYALPPARELTTFFPALANK